MATNAVVAAVPAASDVKPSTDVSAIPKFEPHVVAHLKRIFEDQKQFQVQTGQAQVQPKSNGAADDDESLDKFLKYMASPASNALAPFKKDENDMTWSMANFFISSSHNTYLTGNQLYGEASTEGYKSVLLRGCRCIEIDVWDGESKKEKKQKQAQKELIAKEQSKSSKRGFFDRYATKYGHKYALKWLDKYLDKYRRLREKSNTPEAEPPRPQTSSSTSSASTIPEPRVLHGYTLTKEVSFRDVCQAIRESAFVTSDLPVIVSFEIHCTAEQQEIMVKIIQEEWAPFLVELPKEDQEIDKLPSPNDLLHKILVKVKHAAPPIALPQVVGEELKKIETVSSSTSSSSDEDESVKKAKKSKSIIQALGKLGIYTSAFHFKSLTQPEAKKINHIFSLSEGHFMDLNEEDGANLFSHNRKHMMRVFPSGRRIRSSNLDPSVFWRKGVQIVALNWQRCDEGMMLNEGMFAGSGGFVLKPEAYRGSKTLSEQGSDSDASPSTAIKYSTLDLDIEVFAGQSIPIPPDEDDEKSFRPYVKCELHIEKPEERTRAPAEGAGKAKESGYKQKTKAYKGCNPDFVGSKLRFTNIPGVNPELAFVRFKVLDDEIGKDDLAAWACIRLDRLQSGYRFLHLFDAYGNESPGLLLIKVQKTLR